MANFELLNQLRLQFRLLVGTPVARAKQILEEGQLLWQAKDACKGKRGQFGQFVAEIPLEMRMAQLYMAVATNEVLSNTKYISYLPPTLTALVVLSGVDPPILEAAIADGRVHAKLTPEEAKALFPPAQAASPDKPWSPDGPVKRIHNAYALAFNAELDRAPVDRRDELIAAAIDALPQLADDLQAGRDPDLQDDVQAACDELGIRDAEPGGKRYFDSGGACIGGCKSTYPPLYKDLTTAVEGGTALRRKQVEARFDDFKIGRLPTGRTAHTYFAVRMAIKGQGRRRWN
jgi:hypothetical protein